MNYQEFRSKIGSFTVPNDDLVKRLVRGQNSFHYILRLGTVINNTYKITLTKENMTDFLEKISLLDARGAIRDKDYFIGGNLFPDVLTIEIHTTNEFISDEDFSSEIRRAN
jgi:phosphorylcholine metabolism protein LicD